MVSSAPGKQHFTPHNKNLNPACTPTWRNIELPDLLLVGLHQEVVNVHGAVLQAEMVLYQRNTSHLN